jgi:hypothetical protein
VDQLCRLPALREADRPKPAAGQLGEQPRRFAERAGAESEIRVEERGVPDDDLALGARGRVPLDHRRGHARQRRCELAGVRDRRRCEQELRLGAIHVRQAPQAPQHVADMRAEDAAVHVRLVDDDVAEVVEHVPPAVVMWEDADVEHVRVREDQVRPPTDLPAPLGWCVAVVDRLSHSLQP